MPQPRLAVATSVCAPRSLIAASYDGSMDPIANADELTPERLAAIRAATADLVRATPVLTSRSLSERCGGVIAVKAENLQRTGSFKLRGALGKLATLEGRAAGVVAGSAGNHAQALAYAARAHRLPCEVYVPEDAPLAKVAAIRSFGATVHRGGAGVGDCLVSARGAADAGDLTFVSPYDDYDVIAGQAGVGLELAEDVPDLARVVVPSAAAGWPAGSPGRAHGATRCRGHRRTRGGRRADHRRRHRGQAPGQDQRAAAREVDTARWRSTRRRSPRRWCSCSSAPSSWSRAPAPLRSRP